MRVDVSICEVGSPLIFAERFPMPQIVNGRAALVISSLALVVAMGGASYAGTKIGTAQLKKDAVTSAKIKNDAVTGQDVNEASLGTVPDATAAGTAGTATTAGTAGTATNAAAVDGMSVAKVDYRSTSSTPVAVFSGVGLTLTATCVGNDIGVLATTTKQGSAFFSVVTDLENSAIHITEEEGAEFDTTSSLDVMGGVNDSEEDPALVTFQFQATDGTIANGTLATDRSPGPGVNCSLRGTVLFG
jgi:hypothetical protein